jgi:beta-galactosidase
MGRKTVPLNSHARWSVDYAPGELSAVGYKAGKVAANAKIETTGAPAAVKLIPDRTEINADGDDISIVTVEIVDSKGGVVPTADNDITFDLAGDGRIIGVGNGSPASHEPDKFLDLPEFRSIANWRMKMIDGTDNRPETAETYDDSSWEKVSAENPQMPLPNTIAVFRAHFDMSESDLEQPAISLHFGGIDDLGWIYINGKKAGETNDWSHSWTLDVEKLLKPGKNTVAVVVKNQGNTGGLISGTRLEIARKAGLWQRKAFNGLAQIMVQSTKKSGDITLRAQSEGLEPGAAALKSKECQPRPFVPQ